MTAAAPAAWTRANATDIAWNLTTSVGSAENMSSHVVQLMDMLLRALPAGQTSSSHRACFEARSGANRSFALGSIDPPLKLQRCLDAGRNRPPWRRRRARHQHDLLHLLQAEAEGEGSDEGGTETMDDLDIDNLGLNTTSAFEVQVIGDQGKISGLHGCCNGLSDNIRPTIPVRWYNVPYGADSMLLLVDDMDYQLDGISFPLVLSIIPDIDYHTELTELRSEWHPPGYDVTGLWKGNAECSDEVKGWRSTWCRAFNWLQMTPSGDSKRAGGQQKVKIALHHFPSYSGKVPQLEDTIATKYRVDLGGEIGVSTITQRGSAGPTLKRVPCALRFKLFVMDWHHRYPQWFPRSSGCTFKVEVGSQYDGRMTEVFKRHFDNGYFKQGGWGMDWMVDMTEYVNKKTEIRFTMEGSNYHGKPWWHRFFDWCLVGKPEMFCEGTVTYDFASTLGQAQTVIHSGGHDSEPGRGNEFQNIATDSWHGWPYQAMFYQGEVSRWLGQPTLLSLPVFSTTGKSGAIRTTWNLLESAVSAGYQGPEENKGLGGARAIGAHGARAPCPIDGRPHRIRFRLYARKGSTTSVRYEPDKTSGDDVHHELNLDPNTLAVAKQVVETTLDDESCDSEYAFRKPGDKAPKQRNCAADHGSSTACCGYDNAVPESEQCPVERPICVGYVPKRNWGACWVSRASANCAADHGSRTACCGYSFEVPASEQCPADRPICVGYLPNKEWGHCRRQ